MRGGNPIPHGSADGGFDRYRYPVVGLVVLGQKGSWSLEKWFGWSLWGGRFEIESECWATRFGRRGLARFGDRGSGECGNPASSRRPIPREAPAEYV